MNAIRLAAVTLSLAVLPIALGAQNRALYEVRTQIRTAATAAEALGFYLTPQYYSSSLRGGRSEVLTLDLLDSREYLIVAACDADCSDLDLSLLENDGREVAADRKPDSLPVVRVPKGHGGSHPVRVSMETCSVNPCRYEISVFTR